MNGLTLQGELVSDSEPSHHFGAVAGIDIEKATNGVDADTQSPQNLIPVGTAVTWTYVVTNTGNLTLTNVAVTDDVRGLICVIGTLAPGASTTCSDSSVAVAGLYVNVGHVRRDSAIGHRTDSDPSHYCGIAVGGGGTSITATPTATATPFLRPPRPAHHRRGRRNPPPRAHRRAQPRSHQTQGADWPSVHPSGSPPSSRSWSSAACWAPSVPRGGGFGRPWPSVHPYLWACRFNVPLGTRFGEWLTRWLMRATFGWSPAR